MLSINLLRAALKSAPILPATIGRSLPPDELRYCLELTPQHDTQQVSAALASLLESDRFVLQDLFAAAPSRFLALRFPTLERVFAQGDLFAIGYALADHLGLPSAEPDLGIDAFRDPDALQPELRAESAFVAGLCRAEGDPPPDMEWALKTSRLLSAHEKADGAGILIGHLDTGLTDHVELDASMFALDLAADILDGDKDPTDPLSEGMANPGHGTSTVSVLASRKTGEIKGAAPGAKVVPIRCIEDVKVFNTAPIATAISHATTTGCHVISMSLGGVAGKALHAAVKKAVLEDIIVVAAAGNCVRIVVWPARYAEVIAVAGTNILDTAWKGSSRGSRVTVAAPAEFVWRAERTSLSAEKSLVSAGQGTSYATALVAGAAACWLSGHGRDKVIEVARQRGITVCSLFGAALRATARRPSGGWDTDLGAGVLDAEALLQLPLDAIPAVSAEAAVTPDHDLADFLDEEVCAGKADLTFDAGRYEAEISAIALRQTGFDQPLSALTETAKSIATKPSSHLRAAANASSDERLRHFGQVRGSSVSLPTAPPRVPEDLSRIHLALPSGTLVEGASTRANLEATRDYLAAGGEAKLVDRARRILAGTRASEDQADEIARSISVLLSEVKSNAPRSAIGKLGLEALVIMTGRPALRVINGDVDHEDPRAESWGGAIYNIKSNSNFKLRLDAVGRIDLDGEHQGTGFVVGQGLILTNRHVLQQIASPTPRRNKPDAWVLHDGDCFINFAEQPTFGPSSSCFKVLEVLCAGDDFIDMNSVDLRKVDAAVLRVAEKSVVGDFPAPSPLDVSLSPNLSNPTEQIAVIGYPAQPNLVRIGTSNKVDYEVMARLQAIFGADYGTKYFAPGKVMVPAAASLIPQMTRMHDATTLGGCSGSVVASFAKPMSAAALHFGGAFKSGNYAHTLPELKALGFFDGLDINWVE